MPRDPWEGLGPNDARRVGSKGSFDFFWIVLDRGLPGLMLRLPEIPEPAPRLPKLRNLVTAFMPATDGFAFVLGLKERSQQEIFETLCRDVVAAGEAAGNRSDALSRAIQRTLRWHHLLRGGRPGGLSPEEQRGLVAELAFVRDLAEGLGPGTAIEAWTGPSGSAKDFEFIGTCVEIKARRVAARPFVAISSEAQLADVDGCQVFLRVVNVASAVVPNGLSLQDHVRKTAELFEKAGDAFEAWEQALYSTGYDPDNSHDGRRWQLESATSYEIVEGFPRISSPLPAGVEGVKYSLSLDACAPFKFEDDLVSAIRKGLQT